MSSEDEHEDHRESGAADGAAADGDAALVRAALAGRREAFGLLYDRYAPLVRAVCFDATGGDLSQAQDLAQETFLRAYRKLGGLRQAERFGPWVVGMARHVCREWRRGAGRRRRHLRAVMDLADSRRVAVGGGDDNGHPPPSVSDEPGHAGHGADSGGDDEDLPRLRAAIASLPPREREALHAFYLSGQPADDAARLVGLSRSGFYRAIERAKARLRALLGVSSPPQFQQTSRSGTRP